MRHRFALLAALVVAAFSAAAAPARAEPTATILSYGIFDTSRSGEVEKGERTASGELRSVNAHRLKTQTDEIMGQLGNSFGVDLRLEGFPPGQITLTIRTLHPPITNPKTGKAMTVSEYDWPVTLRDHVYFGYTFDYSWEIAEGIWTKQIIYRGRVLAEKKFKVIVPLN
ncbi:MAG: DUF3859 domain-containing protein [Rhodospirillaceae bacterium]|nr:DUF3859 domain-containing protein [Rhodospirillaceae bacterium]